MGPWEWGKLRKQLEDTYYKINEKSPNEGIVVRNTDSATVASFSHSGRYGKVELITGSEALEEIVDVFAGIIIPKKEGRRE